MSREQLLQVATDFMAYVNNPTPDPAEFERLISPDIVIPLPYPQTPPTYDGFKEHLIKLHQATSDFKCTILDTAVDVTDNKVVMYIRSEGKHTGYDHQARHAESSEWLGIPPTGKTFDFTGFVWTKVWSEC